MLKTPRFRYCAPYLFTVPLHPIKMIFIINIPFYLQYITFYSCKNKHIFPNFQIILEKSANCPSLATEIMAIYGLCRKNQGVSQVVEEKTGGIFGMSGFSTYLCINKSV